MAAAPRCRWRRRWTSRSMRDLFFNLDRRDRSAEHRRRVSGQLADGPRAPAALSHRKRRPAARVVSGVQGSRTGPSTLLASVRTASGPPHHTANAGALRCGSPIARAARRRRHGLEPRLEGQSLGAPARRRSRVHATDRTCSSSSTQRIRAIATEAACTPTSSTRTRRFRSTATSA